MVNVVGLTGSIGSTLVLSECALRRNLLENRCGMITKTDAFFEIDLIPEENITFSGWDIRNMNAYDACVANKIADPRLIEKLKENLIHVIPYRGVCFQNDTFDILSLDKQHIKFAETLHEMLDEIKADIPKRDIVIDVSSTEASIPISEEHQTLESFMELIDNNEQEKVTPSMIYALAALEQNAAFIEFTPNQALIPAIIELAEEKGVPVCGRDASTGQTLYKTIIADMLKKRNLRLTGWYSTNILGNNDGRVLSSDSHKIAKMEDKMNVLEPILGYSDFTHLVDIRYYPPRGDNKEAWDNVDFVGWLDEPMCMKIDWLGKDTILATPAAYDIIRLVEYAQRNGDGGIQKDFAVFFKNPVGCDSKSFLENYEILIDYARKNSKK